MKRTAGAIFSLMCGVAVCMIMLSLTGCDEPKNTDPHQGRIPGLPPHKQPTFWEGCLACHDDPRAFNPPPQAQTKSPAQSESGKAVSRLEDDATTGETQVVAQDRPVVSDEDKSTTPIHQ
ncbi:hypothetical protein JXA32_11885 [Candidatus Sumerlaeota bacterium]|nr:hypothetical protein [Candidatus Sumerlaeota bacterium]